MRRKGFTLIELLVVITIMGILMGLLLVAYQSSRKSARDGKRKTDLEQIRSALEMCRNDKGSYSVGSNPQSGGGVDCSNYLPVVPTDPITPTYTYTYTGLANTYTLCAYLETGSGSVVGCGSCGTSSCNYKVTNP